MNWNQLRQQIDAMTPEQREMEIVAIDGIDDDVIREFDDQVYFNTPGKIHLDSQLRSNFLYADAPYLTFIN